MLNCQNRWLLACTMILQMIPDWVLAFSDSGYGDVLVTEVVSVYDGEIFRVNVDGWPALVGWDMPVRADGFDAPEIQGKCQSEKIAAIRARKLTENALFTARQIELRDIKRDRYFWILADVYVDGKSLKELHLSAGTARPYIGGKREGWCGL